MLRLKNSKGFSLVELIVVIAIMGIMSALIIPKMGSSSSEAKVKAAAREVVTNSRYARDQAITHGKDYTITFNKDASSYTIVGTPDTITVDLPEGVKITSNSLAVTYKSIGTTGNPGNVVITSGSSSKKIEFSSYLVRIE